MDAVVQGASVGLGFAIVDNFIYGMDYGLGALVFRSFFCIFTPMTFSAKSLMRR